MTPDLTDFLYKSIYSCIMEQIWSNLPPQYLYVYCGLGDDVVAALLYLNFKIPFIAIAYTPRFLIALVVVHITEQMKNWATGLFK